MPVELLVTGCYRSGTTLLEKLLHAHPRMCVASQPFPVLYAYVKQLFDDSRGLQRRYPLGHRFLEAGDPDVDFAAFLDQRSLSASDLDAIFEQLARYTEGLWTPEILGARRAVRPGRFLEVYRQLMQAAGTLLRKDGIRVLGSKEILVEQYVPYLLDQGMRVVIIVRDPRDMIASLNYSQRDNATGRDRPVLYSVRIWRKSVATALAFEGHPGFRWLRYEDLVEDPRKTMDGLAAFLEQPPFPEGAWAGRLRDQHGRDWEGNSSFRDQARVSGDSVGRHRGILPGAVRSLIETAAGPEMRVLGYAASESPSGPASAALADYRDPFARVHDKFPPDYSADVQRVRNELERLQRLSASTVLSDDDAGRWFVYPEAYRRLRAAMRAN
jgi:hypothetical protein